MKHFLLILVMGLFINSAYAIDMFISTNDSLPADRMIKNCINEESRSNDTSLKSLVREEKYYLKKQLACINDVQKIHPNIPNVYYVRSQINYDLGDIEQAIIDINNSSLSKVSSLNVYWMRIKLYLKLGKEENIDIVKSNIDKIFEGDEKNYYSREEDYFLDTRRGYFKDLYAGNENDFIWSLYNDKNISSYLVSSTYKYLIQKMEVKEGNICTVPFIASYIQYIYNLEDADSLFIRLGKNKEQILTSYIEAFEKQGGKYAAIIKGILKVASGDVNNGSDIVNANYSKIVGDDYARKMIINSMSILKPKSTQTYSPGVKIGIVKNTTYSPPESYYGLTEIKNKKLNSWLFLERPVISINGRVLTYNFHDPAGKNTPQAEIERLLNGEKDSLVSIEIEDYSGKHVTKTLQRIYPVEGYEYFVFTSDPNGSFYRVPVIKANGTSEYIIQRDERHIYKATDKEMMLKYP